MIDRTDAEYLRLRDDASTGLDGSPGNDTSKYAVDTIDALERENNQLRAATGLCEKHQPDGGARNCLVCACEQLSLALSKISYLCGAPNEMQQSDYDTHFNEQEVVKQVEKFRADLKKCVEALKVIVRKHHLAGDECECIGSYYKALSTPSAQAVLSQKGTTPLT